MDLSTAAAERRNPIRGRIYHHLYHTKEFCSKQTLAQELKLSLPTVYQHLNELMESGLVCYSGEQQSTGGRKASGLSIVPDARIAVGVSITKSRLRFVAADLRLHELAYRKVVGPSAQFSDLDTLLPQELEKFLDANRLDRSRLLGVGIALPGVISPDGTCITHAPTIHIQGVSLSELISGIPYPTHVENDGTCGGFAEWFIRSSQQSMAYLSLETGVGGAVLLSGAPYGGDNRRSGEFGHMCVEPGGLRCSCGKQGCLEAYCSVLRISDDLGITLEEFFSGVEHRVPKYEALWNSVLHHLAIGIGNIRMALDCDVVLGGVLTEYLPPYLDQLKEYVAANNTFGTSADYLHLSTLRKHTVSLGAALLFISSFLDQI